MPNRKNNTSQGTNRWNRNNDGNQRGKNNHQGRNSNNGNNAQYNYNNNNSNRYNNKNQHNGQNGSNDQNRNNRNKRKNNNHNRNGDSGDGDFPTSGLPHKEENDLSRAVKLFWKQGKSVDDIVEEVEYNDELCPWSLKRIPNKTQRLANAVSVILRKEKLTTFKGNARPTQWPEGLQTYIAGLALSEEEPESIVDQIKHLDEYGLAFDHSWNFSNTVCAVGHFIGAHADQLEDIAAGKAFISGSEDVLAGSSLEEPDSWADGEARGVLERLANEAGAKALLENAHLQTYDTNYVNSSWAFTKDAPKFGEPSRLVIRQADAYDPSAPDHLPDPVRPVANASFQPRRCQGTHGCSRHCTWNRDFHRTDGWSQHNFNNAHGISMYMQEQRDEVLFEDADGDVIMADNYPPWMLDGQDGEWHGQRVNWTRCLASDLEAQQSWGP